MPKSRHSHKAYRMLLRLYPKAHRQEYGEQMVQTLDDMISGSHSRGERVDILLRIGRELPITIIEEHINNLGEMKMGNVLKKVDKRTGLILGAVAVVVIGIGAAIVLHRSGNYSPITYAQLQQTSSHPVCLEKTANTTLKVDPQDSSYIGNIVATSITDARAGTNVDVYFKTYDGSTATGTAAYSGSYGRYNFTVQKVASNSTNSYIGGWRVTHFQPCKP